MSGRALREIVDRGTPLPLDAMRDTQYQGVDLSLPRIANAILWKTFRKTFHHDAELGVLRGWNVRMQQTGIDGPREPLRRRDGEPLTFGHYHVKSAHGVKFPGGWKGGHYLDYGCAGNRPFDPGRFGFAPLVAVNPGDPSLLLGWEVMRIGGAFLPIPDYWALRYEGPLEQIIQPPRLPV